MKPFARFVGFVALAMLPLASAAEQRCSKIALSANVQVPDGLLSLADLLPSDGCSALLAAASRVPLGSAPLPGSARLLTGDAVGHLLKGVSSSISGLGGKSNSEFPTGSP